jgi:hypothetical protein
MFVSLHFIFVYCLFKQCTFFLLFSLMYILMTNVTYVINRRTFNSQAGKLRNFEERISGLLIKYRGKNDPFHVVTLCGVKCRKADPNFNDDFFCGRPLL